MADQQMQVNNTANEFMNAVTNEINSFQKKGQLQFPPHYSVENAVKSAWLTIMQTKDRNDKPALTVCTKTSIYNALMDTVVQGLNPSKRQCYYIVYGNQLTMMRSYLGTAAVTMRVARLKKPPFAQVIYQGDELDYDLENGVVHNIRHKQKFQNIDPNKIAGAYCVCILPDGSDYCGIMTMEEIKRSWSFGQSKGNSKAHNNTPGEMAKKTVISRTCKMLMDTSDDSDLVAQNVVESDMRAEEAQTAEEISQNANKVPLEPEFSEVDPDTGEVKEPAAEAPQHEAAPKAQVQPKQQAPAQTTLDAPGF